jgi:hypothetical protein
LLCFDELLKTSDSQPASLTSIGSSSKAAIAAMMVRRGQTPKPAPANFLPDDSNPRSPRAIFRSRFMPAWPKTTSTEIMNRELLEIYR